MNRRHALLLSTILSFVVLIGIDVVQTIEARRWRRLAIETIDNEVHAIDAAERCLALLKKKD